MERRDIYRRLSKSLGRTDLKGFNYLVDAVYLYDEYETSGELLSEVAEMHNTTYSRVERAIRNYKEHVRYNVNVSELFQTVINEKYTLKEFVQNCYDYSIEEEVEYV